jgi:hypothetical protein
MGELTGLLLGFARKHLTGCRDENVLCHGIQLLHDLALRDVQGLDLLKDLSANLPTPEGRDRAASWLKMAQSSRASWEKGR